MRPGLDAPHAGPDARIDRVGAAVDALPAGAAEVAGVPPSRVRAGAEAVHRRVVERLDDEVCAALGAR